MHKFILESFGFFKSCLHFLKILAVFSIVMLMLYWIQHLTGARWAWFGFISPFLDVFVNMGQAISAGSLTLFDAVFEFKYFIAAILYIVLYFVIDVAIKLLDGLKEVYGDGRRLVKKLEEDAFNKSLERKNTQEQEQIKNYQIYVGTSIKKKFAYKESNVNIDEQNKIMNKFLMEKTGVVPTKFGEGFLYSFSDFNHIDNNLTYFFKLIKSEAPLDYIICVQVISKNYVKETEQLKHLIDLKFVNKISTLSDTVWRYSYNKVQIFRTSQLGLFQKGTETFEAHEFEELL